ncbi:DUF1820 family protein [Piscirickettsia litoralis]|uniref:DUF1820 domain-containing protein n=1 Tax=Piscirickettsia litoralis TaxID=1891921 RepID=A0ABX2ZZB5_9GAMM|nr:DUF1820 family protein [Piscirickettsia litoralis]ODN41952.1 hypothetical protein BGC07_01980 [Piscirickettsia litoralis]
MTDNHMYKVVFINQGATYEVYAKQVSQSHMLGFIEVEEYLFERSSILVDPAEEKLQAEFADVKRSYIPVGAVIRIDEVEKKGTVKIHEHTDSKAGNNVTSFPNNFYGRGPDQK